jgi:hypothetical protein
MKKAARTRPAAYERRGVHLVDQADAAGGVTPIAPAPGIVRLAAPRRPVPVTSRIVFRPASAWR